MITIIVAIVLGLLILAGKLLLQGRGLYMELHLIVCSISTN